MKVQSKFSYQWQLHQAKKKKEQAKNVTSIRVVDVLRYDKHWLWRSSQSERTFGTSSLQSDIDCCEAIKNCVRHNLI